MISARFFKKNKRKEEEKEKEEDERPVIVGEKSQRDKSGRRKRVGSGAETRRSSSWGPEFMSHPRVCVLHASYHAAGINAAGSERLIPINADSFFLCLPCFSLNVDRDDS